MIHRRRHIAQRQGCLSPRQKLHAHRDCHPVQGQRARGGWKKNKRPCVGMRGILKTMCSTLEFVQNHFCYERHLERPSQVMLRAWVGAR